MSSSATKSRVPLYLGLAAAGAGGYYLYGAGGDPKQAKDQAKGELEFKILKTELAFFLFIPSFT